MRRSHKDPSPIKVPLSSDRPVNIPDHTLICCVGRGSYGEVWLARNMMGSYRAVKIVYRHTFADARPFERELAGIRKFEPISRAHEGLVDVLHAGLSQEGGYFFYIMEVGDDVKTGQEIDPANYVPKTLAKEIAIHGKLPYDACLRLGLSLTSALAHLHNHGLAHRDVKPPNIIFVNGAPKLADIGLVTDIGGTASYVGTEGFIPPEGPGTAQADIYGLGKVIYEMSTGRDRQDFPALPDDLDASPEAARFLELNEVIVKACHQDVAKRYGSAREMHADIAVLENGQSVSRLRWLERRWTAVKRTGRVAAVVLLALGVIGYEFTRTRRTRLETRQRHLGAAVADGTHELATGNFFGSLPHFVAALRVDREDPTREAAQRLRLGAVLTHIPKLVQMQFLDHRANSVGFSPDGRLVAAAGWSEKVHVLDLETGQAAFPPFGPKDDLLASSYNFDGSLILTASEDGTASLWRPDTGEEIHRLKHPGGVFSAEFGGTGRKIVTSCKDAKARIWDTASGTLLQELGSHEGVILYAEFSPDERWIVTASKDGTAQVWDVQTGQKIGPALKHKNQWIYFASFSPDGQRLVTAGGDNKARLWSVPGGQELPSAMNHADIVRRARFSPDGRYIVTASLDSTVRIWDVASGLPVPRNALFVHGTRVTDAVFSPDGHRIGTSCLDGTVRVFDLVPALVQPRLLPGAASENGSCFVQIVGNEIKTSATVASNVRFPPIACTRRPEEAALNQNGRFVMAILAPADNAKPKERTLQIWNVANGAPSSTAITYSNSLRQALLSEDGRCLATTAGRLVFATDTATGKPFVPPLFHSGKVSKVCFGKDYSQLATAWGNRVQVWNLRSGQPVFPVLQVEANASHIAFSPDGQMLVACTADESLSERSAHIWEAKTGRPVGAPLRHRDGVVSASFSPNGKRIVTASEDFTAVVWEVATGVQLYPALRHAGQVHAACFSPDGRWIMTCCADKTVRVWDAQTGEPITPPMEHSVFFQQAVFVGDGWSVVTTMSSGEAWLWKLPRDQRPIEKLEQMADLLTSRWEGVGQQVIPRTKAAWRDLRQALPDDFRVKNSEIEAWHGKQARLAELDGNAFAVCFHLRRLLAMSPGNETLQKRLTKAERELKGVAPGGDAPGR